MFKTLFDEQPEAGDTMYARGRGRLNTQFRMHRDIAEPVRRVFFRASQPRSTRTDCPSASWSRIPSRDHPHGVNYPEFLADAALVWLDTAGHPACVDEPTWSNDGEVALIEKLVAMQPPPAPAGQEGKDSLVT